MHMKNPVRAAGVTIAILAALAISAVDAAFSKSADILSYIPAETPYAFLSTEPLPDELADKVEGATDNMLAAYQRVIRYLMADQLVKLAGKPGGAEKAERLRGLVEEITGLMSVEGIRGAGIARDSAFAVYGYGLLPVIRVELADRRAFEETIAGIEAQAGQELPVATLGASEYRYLDLHPLRLVVLTTDEYAVMSIVPGSYDESQLSRAVGLEKPRVPLARTKLLAELDKAYGLTGHLRGFVDVERVAATFLGDPGGLNADLLAAVGHDAATISEVCKAEIAGLARVAPRIVFGHTRVTPAQVDSRMVIELRKDLAEGLSTLPAVVPGLGSDPGGFFAFGLGINPLAARNFYEARLDALEAEPFKCEEFSELQAGAASGREALDKPVPPVIYSFRGFLAHISRVEGLDLASDAPPESVDASLLLAIENAEDLVTMAAMVNPEIAALNLLPDGKPVRLELTQLAELAQDAFAALSAGALSVAIGQDAERKAASMLTARGIEPPPLISVSVDSTRYYEILGEAMMREQPAEDSKPLPPTVRAAMRDAMISSGSIYERMSVDVRLTSRGIDVSGRMTVKD